MSRTKRKKRYRLAALLADLTGFPPEGMADMPVLLCRGTMEVMTEGCRAILEYSGSRIRLDMGREILCVEGEGLTMSDFHRKCLTIRGNISRVLWEV
ncbi:MAG: YabP/YqfC family sporulation protein [Clostridia bacterium]|nr:YabP/YqfC family sporulation protein [Clostridia bacterium]